MNKHQTQIEIRWGDMDAYGHVNNTLFFRYFETARLHYFENLLQNNDIAMPTIVLAEMNCRFLRPLVYPATITVSCCVSKLGGSSFDLESHIYKEDGAKRPADPVGWRSQSEGRAFNNKPSCEAGFHTQYERREARHLKLCASSKATMVWVNPKTHRPEEIPSNIRQVISEHEQLSVD